MVDTVYGVNAVSGAPMFSGKQYRQTNAVAFAGATTARPLGVRTGVRPGTPASTVTATSTTWTVQPFAGIADVETAAEASGYPFAFDAVATGSMTAAHATLARIDIIYVQIDDPAESDGSTTPAVTRKYLAGAPNAVPVVPALPVSRAFVIATISVPASGGGSPVVSWVAPYSAAAGGSILVRTVAERDAILSPAQGQKAYVASELIEHTYDGGWARTGSSPLQTYTPTLTNLTIGTGGSALTFAEWKRVGQDVWVHFVFTIGTTGPAVGTIPTMTLPVTAAAFATPNKYLGGTTYYDVSATATYEGRVSAISGSTTAVRLLAFPASGGGPAQPVTAAAPFTWAPGDTFEGDFTYRAA